MKKVKNGIFTVAAIAIALCGNVEARTVRLDLSDTDDAHVRSASVASSKVFSLAADVVRQHRLSPGAAKVSGLAVGDEIVFTLFDDKELTVTLAKETTALTGRSFLGRIDNALGALGCVVLETSEGIVLDVTDFEHDRVWQVVSDENGVTVREVKPNYDGTCGGDALMPPSGRIPVNVSVTTLNGVMTVVTNEPAADVGSVMPKAACFDVASASSVAESSTLAGMNGKTTVDILINYDTDAATWAKSNGGGLTTFAETAVQKMNTALANTGLDSYFQFRLVGVYEVGGSAGGNLTYALYYASGTYSGTLNGVSWAGVASERDRVHADIVCTLCDNGSMYGTVGLGWALKSGSNCASCGFNACQIRSVNASHTMTHEVGHNMGAGHSDKMKDTSNCGPQYYSYSSGYYFYVGSTGYYTIMAYNADGYGNYYTSVPYFSSPSHYYQGVAVGTSVNDNTQTLRLNYSKVSDNRTAPVTTHTVTFNLGTHGTRSGGGALVQTVNDGAAATAPTVSANTGYNWTGWDKTFTSVKSDLTVNATYSLKSYTLTYSNLKGATNPSSNPSTYTIESSIVFTALPNVSGYRFAGWSPASISAGTTGNKTITAQWEENIGIDAALDNTALSFSTGGTAEWFGQTSTTHDGSDALRSGAISHNQTSYVQTTVTGPGTISFWWYASSESASYDYLFFSIDDVQQNKIGGTSCSWTQCTCDVSTGTHTLKWTYRKDGSVSSGLDAGFLDQVVWTPAGPFLYTLSSGNATITGYTGTDPDLTIPATVDGYTVSGIAANALASCGSLDRLTLSGSFSSTGAANKWGSGLSNDRIWVKSANYSYWSGVFGTDINVLDPTVGSVTALDYYSAYGGVYYVVQLAPKGGKNFLIDEGWLSNAGVDISGGVTAALLNATGKNGIARFESYLIGLDPESETPAAEQIRPEISFDDEGLPVITCPALNDNGFITYTTLGKATLTDAAWREVTDDNRADMKFFKVRVDIK